MTPEQEQAAARMRMRARAQQAARSRSDAPSGEVGATIGADVGRNAPNAAQLQEAGRLAIQREMRNAIGGPMVRLTAPLANMITDPERRAGVGRATRGLMRDVAEVANLNVAQLVRETGDAVSENVRNLPRTAGHIATHLPQIAWDMTLGQWQDEEQNQRELDLARVMGNQPQVEAAADRANANTANAGLNIAAPAAFARPMSALRAAGTAAALDAPFALSRNSDQPLQERLPDALAEVVGTTAFGGGTQLIANQAARGMRAPPRTGQMVQRMERAGASVDAQGAAIDPVGIDPSLAAANGGGISGTLTKLTGDNFLAGPMVRGRVERQLTQSRDAARQITESYAQPRSLEGAGRVIQRGVNRYARDASVPSPQPNVNPQSVSTREWSFASKADAVFDQALRPALDNPAPLTNTIRELDAISTQADAPAVRAFQADPVLTRFERVARRFQRGAADGFEPAAADDVAAMAAEIENATRSVGTADQSLATWVRRRGGTKDDRGDIRGADPRGRGASAVLSQKGRSIDDLATSAWEEGFFPGERPPTAREFMDALDADLRAPGSVLRPGDEAASATTSNAREILQYYEQQGIDVNLRGDALQRALRPLTGIDEGTSGRPPTLRDLRELRRKVRMAQTSPGLGQSVDNASLQRIEAALTRDIYAAAGERAADLQAADRFYRAGRTRIDGVLAEFAGVEDVGQAIPRILRMARPNGDTRGLAILRGALRDDEWRIVAASIIDHLGQPPASAANTGSQIGFSVQRFSTLYRSMSPGARKIIFGSRSGQNGRPSAAIMRQLADDLDNLAQVTQNLKGVENMANFSGSATHWQNLFMGGVGVANIQSMLALVAGLGLVGEFLTNPHAVRWLTSAPKGRAASAAGMRRHVAALGQIAARDPALVPIYSELVQAEDSSSQDEDFAQATQRRP